MYEISTGTSLGFSPHTRPIIPRHGEVFVQVFLVEKCLPAGFNYGSYLFSCLAKPRPTKKFACQTVTHTWMTSTTLRKIVLLVEKSEAHKKNSSPKTWANLFLSVLYTIEIHYKHLFQWNKPFTIFSTNLFDLKGHKNLFPFVIYFVFLTCWFIFDIDL